MKPSDQVQWQGSVDSWLAQGCNSAGILVNPVNLAIMADTGVLPAGWYDFLIVMAGSATHFYEIVQHRNVANSASICNWYMPIFGGIPAILNINNRFVVAGERLRIVNINAAVGTYGITISWVRRA